MSKIERISKVVKGFNPDNSKHVASIEDQVAQKVGPGFRIVNFDPETSQITLERGRSMTQVTDEVGVPRKKVSLRAGMKPSDGDREAARLEDQYPGFYMTSFEPYLQSAILEKLTDDMLRARVAVATAMGVKPWDVKVAPRRGGGVVLGLPKSYVPSKHDEKLDEVATRVVGEDGWYVKVNTRTLDAEIIPAEPPTFPGAIPYPFKAKVPTKTPERLQLPLGEILPERAEHDRQTLHLDLDASPHTAINGISGAGKAQPLTETIPVPVSARFPRGLARIGDLETGDEVFAVPGEVTAVAGLSPVREYEVWEVTVEDGRSTRASGDHLWSIVSPCEPLALGVDVADIESMASSVGPDEYWPRIWVSDALGIDEDALSDALGASLAPVSAGDLLPAAEALSWALRAAQGLSVAVVTTEGLTIGDTLVGGEVVSAVRATGDRALMRCLLVEDPRHTYVTTDGITTHNTVAINAAIYGALARGMELAIIDVPAKKVDFLWAKKYCSAGYWGADSLEASVTTMGLIYDEGQRRAQILEDHGVVKVVELPKSAQFPEIFVVVDELTGLFMLEEVPKLAKDDPLRIEAEEINSQKSRLKRNIKKIAAELRFVGIKLLLSTQVASASTGITPDLRTNLGNKALLGAKPTDGNRSLALNDPNMVPRVPANVQNDNAARRGVGVFEFEGQIPGVFKSYYASVQEYEAALSKLDIPTYPSPAPSKRLIAKYTGGGELDGTPAGQDDPWNGRRAPKSAEDQMFDENGKPLRGAAAAAKAGRQAEEHQRRKAAEAS